MKKLLLIILSLLPVLGFSQKKKPMNDVIYDKKTLHFGFTLGLNTMDFILYPSHSAILPDSLYPEVTLLHPGFNINVVSSLKLSEHFNFRFLPGISFGQRSIYYYRSSGQQGDTLVLVNSDQKIESSFLEFPFIFKYKSVRINNWRPYLIGGLNYRLDLAAKKEYKEDKNIYIRLKQSDIYYEVGFGIDFFLKYFKFSTELKLSVGMRDVLVHDPSASHPELVTSIDRLKSKIWILSFHFE